MKEGKDLQVSIIGGGLVGSLCACILGNRGVQVKLYEFRDDIRQMEVVQGKSINLALSLRGRSALRLAGLEDEVISEHGIAMKARMVHSTDGKQTPIPYDREGKCIYSVGRRFLNEALLTAAEKNSSVQIFFKHKFLDCDFKQKKYKILKPDGEILEDSSDLLMGCDGAYSAVRRQMLKLPRFNFSQFYIEHGYLELCIPPTDSGDVEQVYSVDISTGNILVSKYSEIRASITDGCGGETDSLLDSTTDSLNDRLGYAMEVNYLHIWPRHAFMMIALPNQDKTYTVTLFMPFLMFEQLDTPEKLVSFFETNFADALPLIGKEKLIEDFFRIQPSALVSIKCNPYHIEDKVLILGDAAHAMVPFYGQGMNAGFEDCEILSELLDAYSYDLKKFLPAFTERRNVDAEAICDLAMYNYIEMRHLVTSKKFLLRKKLDNAINTIFPDAWIPLYTMVTFTKLRYSHCIARKEMQDKILTTLLWSIAIVVLSIIIAFFTRINL